MKKYISIIVLLSLFVIGCSEQTSINAPSTNVNTNEPNWIALPQAEGLSINQSFTSSKTIYGSSGGSIYLNKNYTSSTGTVTIYAKAYFPQYSFWGSKYITMTVDDQTCTATFSPAMVFNKPVVYNLTYTGINLNNINLSNIKFAYLANDGSIEYAQHEGITVDLATRKISVKNAKIPHFSRYGFVN